MLYCRCSPLGKECGIISWTAAGIEIYGLYGCQTLLNLVEVSEIKQGLGFLLCLPTSNCGNP